MVERKRRRNGRNAQWAAQFAVASEPCKRGHEVAFTLGHNTPLADLMVISPKKAAFLDRREGSFNKECLDREKKETQARIILRSCACP